MNFEVPLNSMSEVLDIFSGAAAYQLNRIIE